MTSTNGAGPRPVAKPGKTSSAKFAEADATYRDKLESMSMTERSLLGLPYLASDQALIQSRTRARLLLHEYNKTPCGPSYEGERGANDLSNEKRRKIIGELFNISADAAKRIFIEPPFWCDYGPNIKFEGDFYCNFNTTILDASEVHIGHGVLFGPNVHIYSATHSVSVAEREDGYERGLPVSIGRNTWVGGNVSILAGVEIGEGCTVGAGSVVTRDLPAWSVAVGNPARIVKVLEESEKGRRDGQSKMVPFQSI